MEFALGPAAREAGYRVASFPEIGSTNAEGLTRARIGDPGRLWLVTGRQTAGRGRRGRQWVTASGNLAASLLLILERESAAAATLGFVAGLALDDALRTVVPSLALRPLDGADVERSSGLRLKWPNDVLLDGAKLAGILLEAETLPDGRLALVVGIGVNIVEAPSGLPYAATALRSRGFPVGARDVFSALSDAWIVTERIWNGGRGFATIRGSWLGRAAGLGDEVTADIGDETIRGVFSTIDDAGRLVMRLPDGSARTVTAGEVHFGRAAMAAR